MMEKLASFFCPFNVIANLLFKRMSLFKASLLYVERANPIAVPVFW